MQLVFEYEMVRGKVQMKKIEDATSRQMTFSKPRNGLLKETSYLFFMMHK